MKGVVPVAEGFEEIEFATIVDILRRAEVEVVIASLGKGEGPGQKMGTVGGSHGIRVVPDAFIDEIDPEDFDAVVLPGGYPGFVHLGGDGVRPPAGGGVHWGGEDEEARGGDPGGVRGVIK